MKVTGKIVALLLSSVLGACAPQAIQSEGSDGLVVTQHDGTTVDVTHTSAGQSVHMTSVEVGTNIVETTFDFGTNVVVFRLDYAAGEGDFISNGQPFDAAEILLVGQLLTALPSILPSDQSQYSAAENAALRQTNLLAEAPVGQVVESFHFVAERGWTYISCGCGTKYDGHGHYRTGGVGCGCTGGSGNGCKGRCGGGCTQDGASINAYTQDCLCHDYGLCSWSTASDDFLFAPSNCGATSGCY
jgi:hypothetical protein